MIPDSLDIELYGAGLSRIYGPYIKDGRKYLMLGYGHYKTAITNAKYLMERHLKVRISDDVHHKNEDKLDDRIDNFEIKSRSLHAKHHAKKTKFIDCLCFNCGKPFRREERKIKENIKLRYNICCSPRCGRVGKKNQAPMVK